MHTHLEKLGLAVGWVALLGPDLRVSTAVSAGMALMGVGGREGLR